MSSWILSMVKAPATRPLSYTLPLQSHCREQLFSENAFPFKLQCASWNLFVGVKTAFLGPLPARV